MTIPNKNLFRFSFSLWLTLGMFVIFALVFAIYVYAEKQIDRANELRQESFLLADELRQSSDDLSRMVRSYVITGDSSYKQHYLEILDIREGRKPRPIDYHNIYWDLVLADNLRPRPSRQTIPLLELMRQAGFTAAEFAKLAQAKSNSDKLTEVEFAAMALIEATNPTTDDNLHKAFELLFGKSYHQAKAGIMRPISEFYQMVDQRTQEAVRTTEQTATLIRIILIIQGVLLISTLWLAYCSLHKTLGCSLDTLQRTIARLGKGNFSSAIPVSQDMENSVLDWLSETQINLARIDTERKQAEMINQYFAAIVQSSDDAIISKDLKGIVTGWNASAERIFGYTAKEMIGNTLSHLFPPDRIDEEKYILEKIADGQTVNHFETVRVRKDGSLIDISATISPIFDSAGKITGASKIARDITERKKTETELRKYRNHLEELVKERTAELEIARDNAEAANRAKSTFIATMSHELRTPLNAILGFSELMSRDATSTAAQKETLTIINRSGAHLLSMINDVLDISKIEAGHLEVDIQTFDLINLLQDIGNMVKVQAEKKRLGFKLEISPGLLQQYVKADDGKLRQVLINLLGNAIKFTRQGGIILRAHTRPLSEGMVMLSLEVADSGAGIAADQQKELFKPFVQLAQEHSDSQGTGLGLAISKSLVELMGGEISVDSVLSVGSTFKIALPISIADPDDITVEEDWNPVKRIAPDQPAWRLLVVDDNADNRLLLVKILKDVGFQVREAKNGAEAVALFAQWQPHLIWMDMRMPVMDGYEATRKIRQLPDGDKVKIIAITASVFMEDQENIIAAGCNALLYKPFHTPELFAALMSCLKVKFIYREIPDIVISPKQEITVEMLTRLPLALRQQLHTAALNLDPEETEAIIAEIRQMAADIADGLQELVQHYQFDQIIHLLEAADVTHD